MADESLTPWGDESLTLPLICNKKPPVVNSLRLWINEPLTRHIFDQPLGLSTTLIKIQQKFYITLTQSIRVKKIGDERLSREINLLHPKRKGISPFDRGRSSLYH
jgi:hypothetical protein